MNFLCGYNEKEFCYQGNQKVPALKTINLISWQMLKKCHTIIHNIYVKILTFVW